MPTASFDLIVIGGGIVGLSTAMAAVERFPGLRLLVLEKEDRLAAHQSGSNSGVIHSGVYYLPGSLKAKTCVEGAAAMVAFCRENGIAHQICGKVVVATEEGELPALEELYRRGLANGVPALSLIGLEQLREIEPHSRGIRALRVPGTAITDFAAVTRKYAEIVAAQGGEVRTGTEVIGLVHSGGETIVETTAGGLSTRRVINCTGLHADRIAEMAGARSDLRIVPFRGEYYQILPSHLVRGLIYPVADPQLPFLGVHLTRTIHGGLEAGPNAVLAFRREGYRKTDFSFADTAATLAYPGFWRLAGKYWRSSLGEFYRSFSREAFLRAIQRLVPEVGPADIRPARAGVRAQALDRSGALVDDFRMVQTEGAIHVLNVPSPAATASLPIGQRIAAMLDWLEQKR